MPRLVVTSDEGEMTLSERISCEDMRTEHFRRCLAERIDWAVADATGDEELDEDPSLQHRSVPGRPATAEQPSAEPGPGADPDPDPYRELVPA